MAVETVPFVAYPKAQWTGEYPPVLKPLLAEEHAGETQASVLKMVVSQLPGQSRLMTRIRFSRSEPVKFMRSRQETDTSDTCPFSQFVADKTSTRVTNQKLKLWVCCIRSFARRETKVAPFGSKRCRRVPSREHEHDDSLQAAST